MLDEIERSCVRPERATPPSDSEAASIAWRQELLAALPRDTAERLDELHNKLEGGQALLPDEIAEMARLEHAMADAAARYLRRRVQAAVTLDPSLRYQVSGAGALDDRASSARTMRARPVAFARYSAASAAT
jgi:hypothetical protein